MTYQDLFNYTKRSLEKEWAACGGTSAAEQSAAARDGTSEAFQSCPSAWMLEHLLDLVSENPHRPVQDLEPVIHRMIVENQFIDDGGDSMVLDALENADREAQALIKALERSRQLGLREGFWSSAPVTPVFFG